jgi:antitoxin component HigA of HigAB toxin-antitoxin module
MKAALIVIQNDADHAEAKTLVARLMQADAETDCARGLAQAELVEAYEKTRWPRKRPALPDLLVYLLDQHGLKRADLIPILGTAGPSRHSCRGALARGGDEQVGGDVEAIPEPLDHRHAELTLAAQHLAHAAPTRSRNPGDYRFDRQMGPGLSTIIR